MKIEKAVFVKNAVETLGYFSEQLALRFQETGLLVYFVDYNRLAETVEGLYRFAEREKTIFCTFNFIGISGEEVFLEENGRTIWENYEMPCLNILVDHPLYFHGKLENPLPQMKIFCADRTHTIYMERFYPQIETEFLPLAGNILLPEQGVFCTEDKADSRNNEVFLQQEKNFIPYHERPYDVVFTGNYTSAEDIYRKWKELEWDYQRFYGEIMEDFISRPTVPLETMLEQHIRRELGEISEKELRKAMSGMAFLDICVRSYFRGELIKILTEGGVKVHAFGAGWERLPSGNPEKLISSGRMVSSASCVKAIRAARISINIMPWFKDGAHDRVFTAMLQKTLSLTDGSRYLEEECEGGRQLVFYSLKDREKLPELVRNLLKNEQKAMEIAENGYKKAWLCHTWKQRAEHLLAEITG